MSYNPYNQPTQGGPRQQPPPPPQSPLPHQRLWRWYRRKSRRAQWGLGCLTLVLLFSCSICGVAAAASSSTPTATITPTAAARQLSNQQTPTQASQIATLQPTATPTPKPSPTPKPTPRPTPRTTQPPAKPTPTPAPKCQAVNGNPWCYNFTPGSLIYSPNPAFCDYFACVSTFWSATRGYVAECANGSYTHSGGVSGACSRDGGVARALYSH